MKLQYAGKNVLVTGSSMGIGKGLSKCFANDGAHLFLTDLPYREEQLAQVGIRTGVGAMALKPGPSVWTSPGQRGRRRSIRRSSKMRASWMYW